MDNNKIKVTDEESFKEVVCHLSQLGYLINFSYSNASCEVVKGIFLKSNGLVEWTHREKYFDLNDSQELNLHQLRELVELNRNAKDVTHVDQENTSIISVAEALRAMACGRLVQCSSKDFPNWMDLEITKINAKKFVDEESINKNGFKYRYKPSQISVNAELTQMKKPQ